MTDKDQAIKVEYHANDKIGVIYLDRPSKMNAFTFEIFAEFEKAVEQLLNDKEKDVRAVVLTSTSKHFTAGLDLTSAMQIGALN